MQGYLERRRLWEPLLWVGFFALNWVANTLVIWLELARGDSGLPRWEPAVWEGTSALSFLALIPLLLWFDRRFPLTRDRFRRHIVAHIGATVPFSLAHVGLMVALREAIYALAGRGYDFGPAPAEYIYEYLKDFRSYATLLAAIYLYRFVLRRWQGEAEFLSEGDLGRPRQPVTDRFLVKKLGREFLVRVDDIEWVEAAGNYVNLHVGGRVYPLRDTMKNLVARIGGAGFARVHRSFIVNLGRVRELEAFDSGDAAVRLDNGAVVAVSRRYLQELRRVLAEQPVPVAG